MKRSSLLLPVAAAALSACGIGMRPYVQSNVAPQMNALLLPPPAPSAGASTTPAPRAEALQILADARTFDEPYDYYSGVFEAQIKAMGETGAIPNGATVEGMLYYFDERVLAVSRAYQELARAAAASKDWARAERYAVDAADVASQRAYSDYIRAQGSLEAWALLEKIQTDRKAQGAALVAQVQRKLAEDFLASPDGKAAARAFWDQEFADKSRALAINRVIHAENERVANQNANAMMGAMAQMQSGLATMQANQVQAQVNRQGYMTRSQASQLQSAQMAKMQSSLIIKMTEGRGGALGEKLSFVTGFMNPTSFRQFLIPTSGIKPTEIVEQFGALAKGLGADPQVADAADKVIHSARRLGQARQAGPDQAQAAFQQFLPQFQRLLADVRKTP